MSTRSAELLQTLDVAMFAFALDQPTDQDSPAAIAYRELMLSRANREGLRRSADLQTHYAAYRLRLAIELAPMEALRYVVDNPQSRWRLVFAHLAELYPDAERGLLEELSRRIATTLTNWQEQRSATTAHKRQVWKRCKGACSCCHFDFTMRESPALIELDPHKPYWDSPEELTSDELDHTIPVSSVGTNRPENLQLLCRWCNLGKGDGLGVDIRREAEFSSFPIDEIPRGHRAAVFYATLSRAGFVCEDCGASAELTCRKRVDRVGFTISNMRAVCYECA
jgi:5-methylcytosine-specific restriction endonuclease McrA